MVDYLTDVIDKTNFEDLKACDPGEVTVRTGCRFDAATGC